jgi:hypothetical protein
MAAPALCRWLSISSMWASVLRTSSAKAALLCRKSGPLCSHPFEHGA